MLVQEVGPPHVAQTAPVLPHALFEDPAWHVPAESQQPLAQFAALQLKLPPVQLPLVHDCPAPHTTHEPPVGPQAEVLVPDWQFPLLSMQPLQAQLVPLLHVSPFAWQLAHCAPPLPHCVSLVEVMQVEPLMHPVQEPPMQAPEVQL